MSYNIELDSTSRDRTAYPNPYNYELAPAQVETWFRSDVSISATERMAVKVVNVVVPYAAALLEEPRLYLDVHTRGSSDGPHKIKCVDGNHGDAKFVLIQDKIQLDSLNAATWIQYKAPAMKQVMNIQLGNPFSVRIFDRTGTVITNPDSLVPTAANDMKQTFVQLELEPIAHVISRVDTY